jgi:hypothetical protein
MQKSQISVFIIISIIMVVSFSLVYYLFMDRNDFDAVVSTGDDFEFRNDIEKSIYDCVLASSIKSIQKLGRQGGFSSFPEDSEIIVYGNYEIPFYSDGENITYISKQSFLDNLHKLYLRRLSSCIRDVHEDIKITSESVMFTPQEDQLAISVQFEDSNIKDSSKEFSFRNKYEALVNFDVEHVVDVTNHMVDMLSEDNLQPLGKLDVFMEEQGLKYGILSTYRNTVIYYFLVNNSIFPGNPYIHVFAFKKPYSGPKYIFKFKQVPIQYISPGYSFTLDLTSFVVPFNNNLTFFDNCNYMDITPFGMITFTWPDFERKYFFCEFGATDGNTEERTSIRFELNQDEAFKLILPSNVSCSVGNECNFSIGIEKHSDSPIFYSISASGLNATIDSLTGNVIIISAYPGQFIAKVEAIDIDSHISRGFVPIEVIKE